MTEDLEAIRAAALTNQSRRGELTWPSPRDLTNIKKYRDEHPNEVNRWTTKHGVVAAWGGHRVYYGTCQTCGGLVTARRAGMVAPGQGGRWPANCPDCQRRKHEEHDKQAKHRMRRLRSRREYPFEDTEKRRRQLAQTEIAEARYEKLLVERYGRHLAPETTTERFYRLARQMGMRDPE